MKLATKKPVRASTKHEEAVKRGKRSRNKGSSYERTIAKKFAQAYGVELVRTPQSGGFMKNCDKADDFRGDILPVEVGVKMRLHVECKNTKKWALPQWLNQAEGDCPKGRIPIIIFHQHKSSKDYVCIPLDDFFELVSGDDIFYEE